MVFETEKEVYESSIVFNKFDIFITKDIASEIKDKRIIFTGMGSSVLFPAKQAKNRALKLGVANRIDVYFASELFQFNDFLNTYVFICSNSGKTKEDVLLLDHIESFGGKCIVVTACQDSVLANGCKNRIILSRGFEKGVAATKSVIEQGLILDSLIFNLAFLQGKNIDFDKLNEDLKDTAKKISKKIKIEKNIISNLSKYNNYYFIGLDNGVAEEICLKTYEIIRKKGFFFPDTNILHGPAEAISGDVAIIFEPVEFEKYILDFQKFCRKAGCFLFGIGSHKLVEGVKVQVNETFKNYCLLVKGWELLLEIAKHLDIDVDHPEKISKVGNAFGG